MDFFDQVGINVANSVIISGVTNTQADDEIVNLLRSYGGIKVFSVTACESPFYKNLAVEFINSADLEKLKSLLPYVYPSQVVEDVIFVVKLLSRECPATVTVDTTLPPDYLHELKRISQQSGQSFDDVLRGVFEQISAHLGIAATGGEPDGDDEGDGDEEDIVEILTIERESSQTQPSTLPANQSDQSTTYQQGPQTQPNPTTNVGPRIFLSGNDLNPSGVQRVVVEHIVRRDDVNLQPLSSFRLRTFSGRLPKPQHEADYESWRSQIELLNADPSLAPLHVTRRILEGLLPPAADLVKGLGPGALPATFLQVLDSAYATVEDGEELFAKFLNTLQDHGERPSSYLQRLQLALSTVVKRGGIPATEIDKYLLKQFCRGCWDNSMINKLQLEKKKDQPPPFSELLLTLRTEEDRQLAKEMLMKKHIPSVKHRVSAQAHTTSSCSCSHLSDSGAIEDLRKQMLKLQSQMSALLSKDSNSAKPENQMKKQKPKSGQTSNRPKPWFCFKCGQDGHIAPNCSSQPNSSLVEEKRHQLKHKQQSWDKSKPLN
ncbi:zinc finger CCHC domain-containing protein 18-like [Xiphophorus hellerii]|uniref:zinc finger CCHC domain-containing protein 18-like n=1 Tax=Xiphophorus hellerii TaxID=8084 RepID=UPI0013B3903B|nr:zinc finger CCHC domain-containing protein 18-like [Xiphophorus hellerii]